MLLILVVGGFAILQTKYLKNTLTGYYNLDFHNISQIPLIGAKFVDEMTKSQIRHHQIRHFEYCGFHSIIKR